MKNRVVVREDRTRIDAWGDGQPCGIQRTPDCLLSLSSICTLKRGPFLRQITLLCPEIHYLTGSQSLLASDTVVPL